MQLSPTTSALIICDHLAMPSDRSLLGVITAAIPIALSLIDGHMQRSVTVVKIHFINQIPTRKECTAIKSAADWST